MFTAAPLACGRAPVDNRLSYRGHWCLTQAGALLPDACPDVGALAS